MKIANIVTSALLGAAVVVLFVLHFTGVPKAGDRNEPSGAARMAELSEISIAYFNMDSVMAN